MKNTYVCQGGSFVKKKLIIIVLVVVVLFSALMLLNNYKNNKKLDGGNPYDKTELHQETIDLLGNDLYKNIITPDDLDERLANEETVTVYYFSPTCSYCMETTPIIVPMTEDLDIEMVKINLLEYPDKKPHYNIEATPTIVHYIDGKEVERKVGFDKKEVFEAFFNEVVVEK